MVNQKSKKDVISILSLALLIFLLVSNIKLKQQNSLSNPITYDKTCPLNTIKTLYYSQHDPINITTDNELASDAVSGNGTSNNPYILEGWKIISENTHSISISGTTKHFIIRNCWLEAHTTSDDSYGIFLLNVFLGSPMIANNTCKQSGIGIYVENSISVTITNNTCYNNNDENIYLYNSPKAKIMNNICNNSEDGICVEGSSDVEIHNNYCSENSLNGIYVSISPSSSIINNTTYKDGLVIQDLTLDNYLSYIVENNQVNNRPIGYFTNLRGETIREMYGQLILINCTEISIIDQDCSRTNRGLSLYYSSKCQVFNNSFNYNLFYGILLSKSNNNTITWNLFGNNAYYAILLSVSSNNNSFHHNTFIDNGYASQAADYGRENLWYDKTNNEGNYWSDYDSSGNYSIDGTGNSDDLFPLDYPLHTLMTTSSTTLSTDQSKTTSISKSEITSSKSSSAFLFMTVVSTFIGYVIWKKNMDRKND